MRCESPKAIKAAVCKKLGVGILYWEVAEEELARGLFINSDGSPPTSSKNSVEIKPGLALVLAGRDGRFRDEPLHCIKELLWLY